MRQVHGNTWFRLSAGAILAITGSAKIVSAFGGAKILAVADPIWGLQFGYVMVVTGTIEVAIASLCLVKKFQGLSTILIMWLATNLLAYRLGLWWMGWHRPCGCLGNWTDALHVPPDTADNIMKAVLAYLLIGGYGILLYRWWETKRLEAGGLPLEPQSSETGTRGCQM